MNTGSVRRGRVTVSWLALVALAAATLLAGGCDAGGGTAVKAGGPAPEIKADAWLNSEALSMAGLKGKIVVVEFWATWCPPCRDSIPHLAKMHEEFKGKDVVLISLTKEPMDVVKPFAEKAGMTWPVGVGSNSGADYGVQGIPHAFIVDREGKTVWRGHPMSGMDSEIRKLVTP
jgi:thiol-disulfide isomerase/thioredoxin